MEEKITIRELLIGIVGIVTGLAFFYMVYMTLWMYAG